MLAVGEDAVEAYGEPFERFIFNVASEVHTFEAVVGVHDTILVEVADADTIGGFVVSSVDIEAVIGHDGGPKQFFIPVGVLLEIIGIGGGVVCTSVCLHRHLYHARVCSFVSFEYHLCILVGRAHGEYVTCRLHSHISVVCHFCTLVLFAPFSGDDHDAVGGSYAIDGCS